MHEACLRHIQDTVPSWRSIFAECHRRGHDGEYYHNRDYKRGQQQSTGGQTAIVHSIPQAHKKKLRDIHQPWPLGYAHATVLGRFTSYEGGDSVQVCSPSHDQSRRSPTAAWINPVSEVAPQDPQRTSTMNRGNPFTGSTAQQALRYMDGNEWTAKGNPFSGPPRHVNKSEEAEQNAFLSSLGDELDAAATAAPGEVHNDDYEGSTGDTPPFSDGDTCEDKDCDPELQYVLWLSLQNQNSAQTAPRTGEKRRREPSEGGKAG
ncbi:hypothetical protein DL769_008435 [Monosporascus sp. CRB-8-3]|nr:hypothetical protein DL769_008435 [Monosporascus sp. CRB-8-3]